MNNVVIELRNHLKNGEVKRFKKLLKRNRDLVDIDIMFGNWLIETCIYGEIDVFKFLVKLGMDINQQSGPHNYRPINEAVRNYKYDIVNFLISKKCIIDVSDMTMNPLFNAIYSGDLEIFKLIFNVVPSYPNRYEDTSFGSIDELAYAKLLGKTEIINFLEEISVKRLDVSDESNKPNELIIKKEDLFSELVLQLRDYKAKSEKILNGISIVVNSDIDSIYCMLSDNKDLVKENHKVLEWEFSLSSESLNYFNKRLSNSSEFIDNIYRENPKYNRLHFIYECLANLKIQSDFIGIEFYIFCDDSYNGLDKKILEYNEKLK